MLDWGRSRKVITLLLVVFSVLQVVLAEEGDYELLRATSTKCQVDYHCPENAVCMLPQGFCRCAEGYVYFEDTCLPITAKMGEPCIATVQCQVAFGAEAECDVKGCQCSKNSHFAEGVCHKNILLGDRCSVRSDCYVVSNASVYCVRSRCECHQGYHPSAKRDDCVKDIGLGESCVKDDECVVKESYCYDFCSCQAGFVHSSNYSQCLEAAHKLGAPCVEDSQCLQFLPLSACTNSTCGCQANCHQDGLRCWKTRRLGETCLDSQECVTPSILTGSTTCEMSGNVGPSGRCRCSSGFVTTFDRTDCRSGVSSIAPGELWVAIINVFILRLLYKYQ